MQNVDMNIGGIAPSRLSFGCMRITGDGSPGDLSNGKRAVGVAVDAGYTLFDLADIYADGACESLFGEVLKEAPGLRDRVIVATKCGIRTDAPKRYDLGKEWILHSADRSLRRLGTESIDLYLLHRPDFLMRAEEVAAAFDDLHTAGKVAHFGVSNFNCSQVDLLRAVASQPILCNQLEINVHNIDALGNGTLDQAQRLGMFVQAWSPIAGVAYPAWGNTFDAEDEARISDEIERQSHHYGVDGWIVALAWLLALPADMSVLIGSTTPSRIIAAKQALSIDYRREDWYRLLEARNGHAVP